MKATLMFEADMDGGELKVQSENKAVVEHWLIVDFVRELIAGFRMVKLF